MLVYRPPSLICDGCPHGFASRYKHNFWAHFACCHGGPGLQRLVLHLRETKNRRTKALQSPVACDECSQTMPIKKDLWTHFQRHHGGGPVGGSRADPAMAVCDDCGQRTRRQHMGLHRRLSHSTDFASRDYHRHLYCDDCARLFATKGLLFRHCGAEHSGQRLQRRPPQPPYRPKTFACDTCRARFTSKYGLGEHSSKAC